MENIALIGIDLGKNSFHIHTFFAKSIPIVLTFMIAALRSMSDDLSSHCGTRDGRRPFH